MYTCTLACMHGVSMSEPHIDELITINILSVGTLYVIHTVRVCIHKVGNDYLAHYTILTQGHSYTLNSEHFDWTIVLVLLEKDREWLHIQHCQTLPKQAVK